MNIRRIIEVINLSLGFLILSSFFLSLLRMKLNITNFFGNNISQRQSCGGKMKRIIKTENAAITFAASVVGKEETQGPMGKLFDFSDESDMRMC